MKPPNNMSLERRGIHYTPTDSVFRIQRKGQAKVQGIKSEGKRKRVKEKYKFLVSDLERGPSKFGKENKGEAARGVEERV